MVRDMSTRLLGDTSSSAGQQPPPLPSAISSPPLLQLRLGLLRYSGVDEEKGDRDTAALRSACVAYHAVHIKWQGGQQGGEE